MPALIQRYTPPTCPTCSDDGYDVDATYVVIVSIGPGQTMQVGPPQCQRHATAMRNAINGDA